MTPLLRESIASSDTHRPDAKNEKMVRNLRIMSFSPVWVENGLKKKNFKLYGFFLAILFLMAGCHKTTQLPGSHALSPGDQAWMEKFFRDIMLDQRAIYTLCGSKPMTTIDIHYHSDE